MVKVKTVYEQRYHRKPNVSEYENKRIAETIIRGTKKWGLGIVSCKIVEEKRP